jgi:myo-inositol catabolism protein IolC
VESLHGRVDQRSLDHARRNIIGGKVETGFEMLFDNMYEQNARISHVQVGRPIEVSRALGLPFEQHDHLSELEELPEDAGNVNSRPLPPAPASTRDAAYGPRI